MEIKRRYTPVEAIREANKRIVRNEIREDIKELKKEVKNLRKSIIVDFAIIMVMVIALIGMYNKIEKLENEQTKRINTVRVLPDTRVKTIQLQGSKKEALKKISKK